MAERVTGPSSLVVDPDVESAAMIPTRLRWRELVAVYLGGCLGVGARWLVGEVVPAGSVHWPTLAVNVIGSLMLGVVVAGLAGARGRRLGRLLVGTGFCGGFTTFSTFALDLVELPAGVNLTYLASTWGGVLMAAWLGMLLGGRARQRWLSDRQGRR